MVLRRQAGTGPASRSTGNRPSIPNWRGSTPADPPNNLVAYTWAGLRAWQAGAPYAIHFQEPGRPIRYEPGLSMSSPC